MFHTTAGGQEFTAYADLSGAGAAGSGPIGDANTTELLGDIPLVNAGADDVAREFRLNFDVTGGDPILGAVVSTSFSDTIVLAGSGGGAIDPFVLLGDLTQDGTIDFADFLIFSANFGAVKQPVAGANLPEPSSAVLLLMGGILMLRRRRR